MEIKKVNGNVITIGRVGIDVPNFKQKQNKKVRKQEYVLTQTKQNKKKAKFNLASLFIMNLVGLIPLLGYLFHTATAKVNVYNSVIFSIGIMLMTFNLGSKHRHFYNFILGFVLFAISFATMVC